MNIFEEQRVSSRVDFSLPEKLDCHASYSSALNGSTVVAGNGFAILSTSLRPLPPRASLAMTKAFTLAEVFSSHFAGRRKTAFTLAEVLITLGIIGIVAAMTMPALITKHQKQVTVTRLRKYYTIMAQAKLLSEVQNGEMEYWEFPYTFSKTDIRPFFDKYFRPYMDVINECESAKSCSSLYSNTRPVYTLKDGMQFMFSPNPQTDTLNSGRKYIHTGVDINGNKGPNREGRDIFYVNIYPKEGAVMLGQFSNGKNPNREELKTGISANSGHDTSCCSHTCATPSFKYLNCGALIQFDGWQIKDDYPW
ncbi:type II secretion system protein [bacterium]|nr:type II secretion system protein [bacterium]